MFCPNCGTKNDSDAVFCSNCGTRLTPVTSTTPPTEQRSTRVAQPTATTPSRTAQPQKKGQPHKPNNTKRTSILVGILIAVLVIGAGVGYYFYHQHQESDSSQVSSMSSSQSATTSTSESSTSGSEPALWSASKNSDLSSFMASWEQTMNQSYLGTYDGHSVEDDGITFPADIKNDQYQGKITIDGSDATLKWTPNADTDAEYQVVAAAAYSHVENGSDKMIAYLYVFHNQQPEVLVSQDVDSTVHNFTQTENQDLQRGFAKIANN